MNSGRLGAVLSVAGFLGLLPAALHAQSCALPQKPMVETQLMFGRNIGGRLGVSESRWTQFLQSEITPRFPAGVTVIDAAGQWRDAKSGRLVREPSKMVVIVTAQDADFQDKLGAVVAAYKRRFHQDSVGVVIRQACVSF
jgi:hypothetical protein